MDDLKCLSEEFLESYESSVIQDFGVGIEVRDPSKGKK
jgi:hypothetical protein